MCPNHQHSGACNLEAASMRTRNLVVVAVGARNFAVVLVCAGRLIIKFVDVNRSESTNMCDTKSQCVSLITKLAGVVSSNSTNILIFKFADADSKSTKSKSPFLEIEGGQDNIIFTLAGAHGLDTLFMRACGQPVNNDINIFFDQSSCSFAEPIEWWNSHPRRSADTRPLGTIRYVSISKESCATAASNQDIVASGKLKADPVLLHRQTAHRQYHQSSVLLSYLQWQVYQQRYQKLSVLLP